MAFSGTCPCGGHINDSQHEVKTLHIAQVWFEEITSDDLPVTIEQRRCRSCGRVDKKWRGRDGVLREERIQMQGVQPTDNKPEEPKCHHSLI
jgi:hypothetical protein